MTVAFSHDHIGITVTPEDLEATIQWYADKLGFTVEQRFDSHGTTFVFLVASDVKIELLAGATSRSDLTTDNVLTSMSPQRLHHFCICVHDLDATVSHLNDLDVSLTGGPMDIPEIDRRIAFVTDNLGTIIELAEPGARDDGRRH